MFYLNFDLVCHYIYGSFELTEFINSLRKWREFRTLCFFGWFIWPVHWRESVLQFQWWVSLWKCYVLRRERLCSCKTNDLWCFDRYDKFRKFSLWLVISTAVVEFHFFLCFVVHLYTGFHILLKLNLPKFCGINKVSNSFYISSFGWILWLSSKRISLWL